MEDKMGRAGSMHEMRKKFWLENPKGREHSEDIDTDGMIILKWMLEKRWEGVD
jgi:hypothetical protein